LSAGVTEVEPPPVQGQSKSKTPAKKLATPPHIEIKAPRNQASVELSEPLAAESSSPVVRGKQADPCPEEGETKLPSEISPDVEPRQEAKPSVAIKQQAESKPASTVVPPSPPPLPAAKPSASATPIVPKSVPSDSKEQPSTAQQPETPLPKTKPVTAQQTKTEPAKTKPEKTQQTKTQQAETNQAEARPSNAQPLEGHPTATESQPSPSETPSLKATESEPARGDGPESEASESHDSSATADRNGGSKPETRPSHPQPAADASRATARPPLPSAKARAKANPKPVRPKPTKSPATKTAEAVGGNRSRSEKAASHAAVSEPSPEPPIQATVLPGYQPTEDHVAIVRAIGVSLAAVAAISVIPAVMDIVDHIRAEASLGVARWAYLVLMLATLQVAYSTYVFQLPDWSTVWVVTIVTLVISTGYAMMLGLSLIADGDGWLVSILELGDAFRGGRVSLWCFVMLCLTSLVSYFSGRISVRWRGELTAA
jgi:hypothetical protein